MNWDQKYRYDPESCTFVEVERTWKDYVAHYGQIFGLAVILTGLAVWGLDVYLMTTPQERSLKVENQALEQQLDRVSGRMSTLSAQLDTLAKRDQRLYRRLFQMKPISEDVRQVGVGGADPYKEFAEIDGDASSLLKKTAQKLDKLERQTSLQGVSYERLTEIAEKRSDRLVQLPAIRPANGPIVSGYGMRQHPILKVRKMHSGVDFLLRPGTPVMATGDGEVRRATFNPAYGNFVEIRHPKAGYFTRYAHLSEIPDNLRRGVEVERGDTIGYSGNSGRSTGPHLHYEVHKQEGKSLDPMRFFVPDMTPEEYHELEQRTMDYQSKVASVEQGDMRSQMSR